MQDARTIGRSDEATWQNVHLHLPNTKACIRLEVIAAELLQLSAKQFQVD